MLLCTVLFGLYKEAPPPRKGAKAFVLGGVMCACVLLLVMDLCAFDGKKAITYHYQCVAYKLGFSTSPTVRCLCVCVWSGLTGRLRGWCITDSSFVGGGFVMLRGSWCVLYKLSRGAVIVVSVSNCRSYSTVCGYCLWVTIECYPAV